MNGKKRKDNKSLHYLNLLETRVKCLPDPGNISPLPMALSKLIIENSNTGTIIINDSFECIYANNEMANIVGVHINEIIGSDLRDYLPDESRHFVADFYSRRQKGERLPRSYEVEFCRKGGERRTAEIQTDVIKTDDQQILTIVQAFDVTDRKQMKSDTEKSEKKYRDLFENVLDFVFIHDLEGNFIENNARYVTEVGGIPEAVANSNMRDLIPERFRDGFDDYLARIKQNGRDEGVICIQTPSGKERILEYKNLLILDDDHRPTGVMGSARDITEHIKDKRALRESKERYQMLIDNVEDLVFEQDLAGNFTFINDSMVKKLGYTKDEMIGMHYSTYTLPEEKELIKRYHRQIYKTGKAGKGLQHRVVHKDGSIFYVELCSSLMKNSNGKPIGYRGISRDITERKLAEKVLMESKQHLNEIIEGIPVPTIVFDKYYNIEYWNRACEELTGIKSSDVIGQNKHVAENLFERSILPESMLKDIGAENISKKPGLDFEKSTIVKNAYEVESFFPHLGNNGKWLFITASPLENPEGKNIGIIETILDITAIKQAEIDLKKSEGKYRDFFENVLDFIFIHDLEGNFIENNARYVTEVGARPEIIAKSNLRDLMPEIFKPEFDIYLKRITKNGRDEGVIAIQAPDVGIRILEYKNLLLYGEDNQPVSVLGSARDITEHIRDKKALRESKERYQMILENVGDYIFEIDLAGNYTFVNEALIKTSKYTKEELIGMNYHHYTFPEEQKKLAAYFHEIFTSGETGKGIQHRVVRKDGSFLFIELVVSLIKDGNGHPVGFRGVARDVTERRLAEKILKKSEQQLKEIIEGTPIPTIVFDKDYHITHWNRASESLTDVKAIEVIGQNKQVAEELINQSILPDFLIDNVSLEAISAFYGSKCRKSKIVKNAYEVESFFPHLGENGKWLYLTLAFLRDHENNIIGVIETLLDVTSQKMAGKKLLKMHEELEEKVEDRTRELQEINIALEVLLKKREKDKKQFEEKVAYSIKEVLTPHLELLKNTHLDKHQKVYLEILEDNFKEIFSPFMPMLFDNIKKMTRTEIQVINLIKQNKITKEIADLMGISTRTVEAHRDNIRKKLGIKNKKFNLRSFLLSLE